MRDAASALVTHRVQSARCPSSPTANLINMRRPVAVTCEQVTAGLTSPRVNVSWFQRKQNPILTWENMRLKQPRFATFNKTIAHVETGFATDFTRKKAM